MCDEHIILVSLFTTVHLDNFVPGGHLLQPILQVMMHGREKIHSLFLSTMMGWNLVRMRNLQV